ncbi:MAG: UDP-3-O-(3-hydroxymyristoyl)glucosamine N-acyltransferase, partial [Mariprofundales bacterium]|nr:UDP-3-O-(3-hydroxymyristoyl)glucosamine N-acyltransferase [Mariprofundales bacterium]
AANCRAGLLLVTESEEFSGRTPPLLRLVDPYLAFARLQRHFFPQPAPSGQRHATAVVDESATVADDVDIAARCVVGAGVVIGSGSRLDVGVILEERVVIGSDCHLHSGVVIAHDCRLCDRVVVQSGATIGSDGFGYAWDGSSHLKIPQVGAVVLEDGVEVGANSCIDRGALGDTVVGAGTKIDNLVQIGHNVQIGEGSIVVSQVGISGSTTVGRGCQIGGQAGLAGHLNIGDGVRLAAKSGVIGDIVSGQTYAGLPAMPHRAWLKLNARLRKMVR